MLLPEAVEDYVGPDNPVRFIDAFVDQLDLAEIGFVRAEAKETGRPGYHPADLLKLYIYGYLNRVRSSRRLEAETRRNLEVTWLMGQLTPDFKTIADFRRENCDAFRKVFREFVALCRDLDLFGRELIAVDGTQIKAVNSRERNFTKARLDKALAETDERLARYLEQLDATDRDDEDGPSAASVDRLQEKIEAIKGRRERLEGHRKILEESGEEQVSLTDPDARASRSGVGYNAQIAVDTRHKLIAEQQVHVRVGDLGLLTETASAAREILGVERIEAVADRGYFKIEDIEACEAAGIVPYVPKPIRGSSVTNGFFTKEAFAYDPAADVYTCPGGHRLKGGRPRKVAGGARVARYTNRAACRGCPLKARCTNVGFRVVNRFENEAVLDRMADRLATRPDILDQRRESVEHPFGSIKQWMGQGAFLMRGLGCMRAEFSLTALAYNLRRAITILGLPALIAAVRA
jgi:transposase